MGADGDASWQALVAGPKTFAHASAVQAHIQRICSEMRMPSAMRDKDKQAAGHLQLLLAYLELSFYTVWVGGVPVEQVHDVRPQLQEHLECAQSILRPPRNGAHPQEREGCALLAQLTHVERSVHASMRAIAQSAQDSDFALVSA